MLVTFSGISIEVSDEHPTKHNAPQATKARIPPSFSNQNINNGIAVNQQKNVNIEASKSTFSPKI